MTNLAQFLLVIVITTLTFLVAFVAVQVIQILHEVRQVVQKINRSLQDDLKNTSSPVSPDLIISSLKRGLFSHTS